jgi:hypothetical protein
MQPYGRRATTMWLHGGGRAGTPESHCAPIDTTPFQATTTPQQEKGHRAGDRNINQIRCMVGRHTVLRLRGRGSFPSMIPPS